jgi:phosphatidylserine decarboxylase
VKNQDFFIAREGLPFFFVGLLCTLLFCFFGLTALCCVSAFFSIYVLFFFRNPKRVAPEASNAVISPADGKVIFIGEAKEVEFTNTSMMKVSIFMSLTDVHINRMPVDGTIEKMQHRPGKFLAAWDEKATEENERQGYLIKTPKQESVVLFQVAGLVARRIVSYLKEGLTVAKGNRIGLIRFGSRCDLFLPLNYKINVTIDQKVAGGETVVAYAP